MMEQDDFKKYRHWVPLEVKLMLNTIKNGKDQPALMRATARCDMRVFRIIAEQLTRNGFPRDASQVTTKFKLLRQQFYRSMITGGENSKVPIRPSFFKTMMQIWILAGRPSPDSCFLMGTGRKKVKKYNEKHRTPRSTASSDSESLLVLTEETTGTGRQKIQPYEEKSKPTESTTTDDSENTDHEDTRAGGSQIGMGAQKPHLHHEASTVEQQMSTSVAMRSPPVPLFGFEEAFTFVSQKGKNMVVQCNYCLPGIKYVGCGIRNYSNFKQHLKKAHPEQLRAILKIVRGKGRQCGRQRQELPSEDGSPAAKMPKKQHLLDSWRVSGEILTQSLLDSKLMDYVVQETVPPNTVEKPTFRALVGLGLPGNLTIMCAETLRDTIERRAAGVRETLAQQLALVPYVATAADCWTSGRTVYLWVTAHWINPASLKREWGALACKQLEGKGPPSYGMLVKVLHEVHAQYGIHNKVTCVTVDGSKHFKAKGVLAGVDIRGEEGRGEKVEFVSLSEILDTGGERQKEGAESHDSFRLPSHRRCTSHTLNLVATQDMQAMILDSSNNSPLGAFRSLFLSLMEKCGRLWSEQSQFAKSIRELCGTYLKVPDETRWSNTFESLKQLNQLLITVPEVVDEIMDRCSLDPFTKAEQVLLQEYVEIMDPLARALDILQRENSMFMGYLLPTLYSLTSKLQRLENKPYVYGQPILKVLRSALRKRFDSAWEDKDLLLAACLHPFFKLGWLDKEEHRTTMEAWLKAELQDAASESNEEPVEDEQESDSDLYNYFDIEPGKKKSDVSTAVEEISTYLKIPRSEVSSLSLHSFPRISQIFLRYNTAIPSSAAMERLFSMDARAVAEKSHSMPGDLLEQLLLVKQNGALSVF